MKKKDDIQVSNISAIDRVSMRNLDKIRYIHIADRERLRTRE